MVVLRTIHTQGKQESTSCRSLLRLVVRCPQTRDHPTTFATLKLKPDSYTYLAPSPPLKKQTTNAVFNWFIFF